ncbi:hypothetical protein GOBAR_AA16064 [Gossypium barbadense]|uniref:Uncharacterized protein n=1 Tax=Gossypium barbadense TaxID=3634 RepID=A0A2P5XML6_GOSBA|nr:hypothetical protein GOBAR_AA16064 [Gossypium barbadense]
MVVVEQDMAVMENLPRWSCSSYVMMSLGVLYNCDKIRNFLGVVRKCRDWLFSHARASWARVVNGHIAQPCLALFASPTPVCYGSMPVDCCTRLKGTGVSPVRVEETESSLIPGTPVGFHPHARVFPIEYTHSHVAQPWGFITPCVLGKSFTLFSHSRIARTCFPPCWAHSLKHYRVVSGVMLGTCASNTLLVT